MKKEQFLAIEKRLKAEIKDLNDEMTSLKEDYIKMVFHSANFKVNEIKLKILCQNQI